MENNVIQNNCLSLKIACTEAKFAKKKWFKWCDKKKKKLNQAAKNANTSSFCIIS